MYGEDKVNKSEQVKSYVKKLMRKFDADQNGLLSEKEFVDGCLKDPNLRLFLRRLYANYDDHVKLDTT